MRRIIPGLALLVALAVPAAAQTDPEVADARDLFLGGDHGAALAVLVPAAEAGHPRAQNIVGSAYQYGQGVAPDATQALHWFGLAAAQGYPPALHNLGVLHENGMAGLAPDQALARENFARAAALDYPPGLAAVGAYLLNGQGGPADPVNALRAFRRGAEMGDARALEWMGWLHRTGEGGVALDPARARDYYLAAAAQGQPGAQNELGWMFETGEGGPVDPAAADGWYRRAVAGDHAEAGVNLAWMIWENPAEYPDQVEGLAHCLWAVDVAEGARQAEYRAACAERETQFTPEERQLARKRAAAL